MTIPNHFRMVLEVKWGNVDPKQNAAKEYTQHENTSRNALTGKSHLLLFLKCSHSCGAVAAFEKQKQT